MSLRLWEQVAAWKSPKYRFVDLTHELSPETPHWWGFKPLKETTLYDYPDNKKDGDTWTEAPMQIKEYTVVGQYGTHVDAPIHFDPKGRTQEQLRVDEMVYPLVVIDKSKEVAENPDYELSVEDVLAFEEQYGRIPEGAFVAFRTDWYKQPADDFQKKDADGNPHTPGWTIPTLEFLVKERNIGAIGHETADTDAAIRAFQPDSHPLPAEQYILSQDRIQVEVLAHLDELPPVGAVIFVTFPKLKGGTGFAARCFALVENE